MGTGNYYFSLPEEALHMNDPATVYAEPIFPSTSFAAQPPNNGFISTAPELLQPSSSSQNTIYQSTHVNNSPHVNMNGSTSSNVNMNGTTAPNDSKRPNTFKAWLDTICLHVINDMNKFGICVIDNFLGQQRAEAVLKEVKGLYNQGVFSDGQLVGDKLKGNSQNIRGDKILWVNGTEMRPSPANNIHQPSSNELLLPNVNFLIRTLDQVIFQCDSMTGKNGIFSRHKINKRTKAMIACYPGSGTGYVKHVDNPNADGRCITAIYYLNKDWNTARDGGILRIFPVGFEQKVAEIEPLFDRALFFWSDRRNPHEVQAAYSVRFAITVWYFDARERKQALDNYQRQKPGSKMQNDEDLRPFQ